MAELRIAPTQKGTVSITSGSATVTGTGTQFTSADVGKQIIIRTIAGDKQYAITAYTSATSITISSNADYTQSGCYFTTDIYDIDTIEGFPYSFNFNIADIREPDKRNSNFSKTIILPGTANNNNTLRQIFEVNIDGTFNPNLRADAYVTQDTIQVFRGNMQLLKVVKEKDKINYEISIFGSAGDLFMRLSAQQNGTSKIDKLLTDLDLSEFNHAVTKANQIASWTAPIGSGYVYPLINNGFKDINVAIPKFDVNYMCPSVYVKTLVDKIFASTGFRYSSNFFNSNLFKRLIIPCYGQSGRDCIININISYRINDTGKLKIIRINSLTGLEQVIKSYNYTTPNVTVNVTDSILLSNTLGNDKLKIVGYSDDPLTQITVLANSYFEVVYKNKNQTNINDGSFRASFTAGTTYNTTGTNLPRTFVFDDDSTGSNYDPDNSYNTATGIHTSPILNLSYYLPDKITQRDFLTWIIKLFNLYIDPDRFDYYTLNIEPRDDYYNSETVTDWTNKLDIGKEINIIPMGELDSKYYSFGYKEDGDYYNKYYKDNYAENYGDKLICVNNDFLTNTKEIKVGFSPTPLTSVPNSELIIPSIIKEGTSAVPNNFNGNIRILYWGGMKTGKWYHGDNLGNGYTLNSSYPYAGHLDDPQNPTLDLCFEQPRLLFYKMSNPADYTTNNLYNNYYSLMLAEIADKDAKLLQMFIKLNVYDIYTLSFRNKFYIDGTYYHLNKISNFNPENGESTLCEFVKINEGISVPAPLIVRPFPKEVGQLQYLTAGTVNGDLQYNELQQLIRVIGITGILVSQAQPADGATLVYNASRNRLEWSATAAVKAFLDKSFDQGFS